VTYTPADIIEVVAWDRLVGAVVLDPETNFYAFEYDDAWIVSGVDLSPLHLPRRRGVFEFPELSPATFYGLPAMLADALPDRFGNALVDAWMAEHGVEPDRVTALDRLAYASNRAIGALRFAPPAGPSAAEVSMVQLADLVTAARAQILGHLNDVDVHDALASLISVGTSAGGARAKAVLAFNPTSGQMRSGQLGAPEGYEYWLLKLDGVGGPANRSSDPFGDSEDNGRVEYAYYLMATHAGIEMSPSRLLLEGPRAHFMTRRFDRGPSGERLHLQTLCALAHLDYNVARTHSYSSYFLTARALGLGPADRQQMLRRVAFNIMAVNRDDHPKNVAFLLSERGEWQLAPAYDVTHSFWSGARTQQHQMSVNGHFDEVSLDDLRVLGDAHEVPGIESVLDQTLDATQNWRDFAATAGVRDATMKKIANDIATFRPR
jgi:serine/threonine-protein kinase HipA